MIHGLILVNKPSKMTSHNVVDKIRRLFKIKKVGHFGTLDPMAKGLLMIGMGHATKFFDFYTGKRKVYSGRIIFGYATTTYDIEGEPTSQEVQVNFMESQFHEDLSAAAKKFRGKQMQMPPIYSAKKYKGKPLYKYARENRDAEVEIKPSEIEIFSLDTRVVAPNQVEFRTETSSGTYIRSLAHDIGQELRTGAFLAELIREKVGEFHLDDAYTLEQLEEKKADGTLPESVTPIEALLPEFPKIIVTPAGRKGVINGMPLLPRDVAKIIPSRTDFMPETIGKTSDVAPSSLFRLFDDQGKLLAISRKDEYLARFKPYMVFPQ